MKDRDRAIDFLRGTAVILMIIIHVTAYYLSDKTTKLIWDYTHFAVPLFVFCAAYVYFIKSEQPFTFTAILKRVKRLIVPYYLFIGVFFLASFLIKNDPFDQAKLTQNLLLMGNRDLNWLVVLFLTFILLFPLIKYLERWKPILWLAAIMSFLSTLYLLIYDPHLHFRTYMWVPWSSIVFIAYFFAQVKKKIYFMAFLSLYAFLLFLDSRFYLFASEQTHVFTENKYPPDLYYLSYGMWLMGIIYILHTKLRIGGTWLQQIFDFFSKHSYEIFFIHFFYLLMLLDQIPYKQIGWIGMTAIVTILTWATIVAWEKLQVTFSRR
jgi:peptidoglycan/LPS O-acetylase OafA/YrhL